MERYKGLSGLSYRQIADRAGVNHAYVFRAVNMPHTVSKKIMISVANIIGCPEDQAIEIWKESKIENIKKIIERQ
jgi:transcriptional regulator with XRE-family HTH domain